MDYEIKTSTSIPNNTRSARAGSYPFADMPTPSTDIDGVSQYSVIQIPLDASGTEGLTGSELRKEMQDRARKLGTNLSGAWRRYQKEHPAARFVSRTDFVNCVVNVYRDYDAPANPETGVAQAPVAKPRGKKTTETEVLEA
jgi:hypothetical protein